MNTATASLSTNMQKALTLFKRSNAPRFLLHLFERETGEYRIEIDLPDTDGDNNAYALLAVDFEDPDDRYANVHFPIADNADEQVPTLCVITLRQNALTVSYQTTETPPHTNDAQTILWADQWSDPIAIEEFLEQAELTPDVDKSGNASSKYIEND